MKKALIVLMRDFSIGGSLTSLLNLLRLIKEKKVDVQIDLLMMHNQGTLFSVDIDYVHLLHEEKRIGAVMLPVQTLAKERRYADILYRCLFRIEKKISSEQNALDRLLYKEAQKYRGYDVVIAYQENLSTRFVQYIPAPHKIAWVHNNFERIAGKHTVDEYRSVYGRYEDIVGVSAAVVKSLEKNLPEYKDRYHMIYNPLDTQMICAKAEETVFDMPEKKGVVFISVGRFATQKRFDRIPEVAAQLKRSGLLFQWLVVGDGEEYSAVLQKCREYDICDCVYLLGARSNPYPYIKAADVVVLTSQYEAHPMVINEGLILQKPVITTHYPSACEVVSDGMNGIICANSVEGITRAMVLVMEDSELRKNLAASAESFIYDNESVVEGVLGLLEL